MKQYIFLIIFYLFFSTLSYSQVTIGTSVSPGKAALLDLKTEVSEASIADNESSDKGFLLSRVSLVNINTLAPFITSPSDQEKKEHVGLMVYNVNTILPFQLGVYIWNGNNWVYTLQQTDAPILDAANGISKATTALRLGGTLTEETTINQTNYNLKFGVTTGKFSVNTNNFSVANGNIGIGTAPTSTSKLTVGGDTNISGNLNIGSTSSLKKTTITDTLQYIDPAVANPNGYILKSTNGTGTATWVDVNTVPNINTSPYIEGVFTGGGITMSIADWNRTTATYNRPINTAKLTLPPGLWLIYMSLVIEPLNVITTNADPIWGRFSLRENSSASPGTGVTGYNIIGTTTSSDLYRIGALDISDRLYSNVTKNVIKGYLIVRVKNNPRNFYAWVGNRSAASGYVTWGTGVGNVKIGDSNDPQNYIVAFPL